MLPFPKQGHSFLKNNMIGYFVVDTGFLSEGRPRWLLVVSGDSARIHGETTENSARFFNVLGV